MRRLFTILGVLALVLGVSRPADAQTPVIVSANSGVAFTASSDQTTVIAGTQTPKLDHYDLTVIAVSPTTATGFTFGLGKPTPDATNTITVKPIASFGSLADGMFSAFVNAVGPGGSSAGAASDSFERAGAPAAPGKATVVPK